MYSQGNTQNSDGAHTKASRQYCTGIRTKRHSGRLTNVAVSPCPAKRPHASKSASRHVTDGVRYESRKPPLADVVRVGKTYMDSEKCHSPTSICEWQQTNLQPTQRSLSPNVSSGRLRTLHHRDFNGWFLSTPAAYLIAWPASNRWLIRAFRNCGRGRSGKPNVPGIGPIPRRLLPHVPPRMDDMPQPTHDGVDAHAALRQTLREDM